LRTSELERKELDGPHESAEAQPVPSSSVASRITVAVGWLGLALSLWLLFLRLSAADPSITSRVWLSSDILYPVNVFTDVFIDGSKLSGWRFSIAPCWFPDLVATGLFLGITRNVVLASLLAGFIQIVALVLLCRGFARSVGVPRPGAVEPVVLLAAVLMTIFVANHPGVTYPPLYQLFLPQSHVGSVCAALGAMALGLAAVRRMEEGRSPGRVLVVGYVALCVLGGMSNLLFLVNAIAPLSLVAAVFVPLGLLGRRSAGLLLLGWPAAALGILLNRKLFRVTDLAAQSGISRARIATSIEVFVDGLTTKLGSGDPLHLTAVLWVLVCAGFVLASLHAARTASSEPIRRREAITGMLFLALLVSGAAGCAAIVLGGSNGLADFKDYVWTMHYLHPTFLVPLFAFPALGAWSIRKLWPRVFPWVQRACALIACALPLQGLASTRTPPTLIEDQVPPLTQFMDQVASREHLKYGFAGYWQARPITLFSRTGLRAYAVDGSMNPYLWVSNLQWYEQLRRKDGKGYQVDFVILDDPLWKLSRESAVSTFGEPREELRFENTRILIYGGRP
jgi:hypothetical protein